LTRPNEAYVFKPSARQTELHKLNLDFSVQIKLHRLAEDLSSLY